MMGIVHAAFRRDLARVRLVLTAARVPQGERKQAVADQVEWLTDRLHEHHHTEDAGLWPLIRQRNPAAAGLLEATHQIPAVPRFILLRGFARPYRRRREAWWSPQVTAGRAAASR